MNIRLTILVCFVLLAACGGSGGSGGNSSKGSGGTNMINLAKTGQTTCYAVGSIVKISCSTASASGQDGATQKGIAWPDPRFTTNGDTTVTDNLTNLVWGPNGNLMPIRNPGWDTDGSSIDDGAVTWQHALDYVAKLNAENYLGHSDWRLPNRKELWSLANGGEPNIATWLNSQGFSNAQSAGICWTSTSFATSGVFAWHVYMTSGAVLYEYKTNHYHVWPVRSGQIGNAAADQPKTGQTVCYDNAVAAIPCSTATVPGQDGALQKGVVWPNPRFTKNSDTTVSDNLTGLVWESNGNLMHIRNPGWGLEYIESIDGEVTWEHALDYVAKLNAENYLGHNDWRLPNINELESLVNAGVPNTATWLNTQGFTNVWSSTYWSSTSHMTTGGGYAWGVYIDRGSVNGYAKSDRLFVLPVRAGQ